MKIISSYKDYYDTALAYGVDDTTVYVRKHQIVELCSLRNTKHDPIIYDVPIGKFDLQFSDYEEESHFYDGRFVISFCGKTYIGIKLPEESNISFKPEDIEAFLDRQKKFSSYYTDYFTTPAGKDFMALHRKFQAPVLAIVCRYLHINPNLRLLDFFRVVEPYTAFQEIEMFISGVLGSGAVPTEELSDRSKILKHGHDLKYSFRKLPDLSSNKSRRKQKN